MIENPEPPWREFVAYRAAHRVLDGRYIGPVELTAKHVALLLGGRDDLPELVRSFDARAELVDAVVASAALRGARGWRGRMVRPLIDAAVAVAAKAMLDADAFAAAETADDDTAEPVEPIAPDTGHAFLVVSDRQIGWAGLDGVRADEYARNVGGVVVRVPIVADYRPAGEGDRR